mmetsp:Transcript_16979/g.53350  ORF Transcript_16979/g.53350 Transcript_16979/m.53350 type:complete len:327 (-) Transcript_16979:483-1463(-)
MPHGVHGVAEAGDEDHLQLLLEHVHTEELGELGNLLHHDVADAPVVVDDQVLYGVHEGVHEPVHAEDLANEAGVRHDVQAHVVELVLHELGDQAQQVPLCQVPAEDLRDRPQHLRQGGPDRLRGISPQRREVGKDVRLQLLAGERLLEVQAGLDHPQGLLADLLLVVLHQQHEGLHQGGGHDLGAARGAELVEVLGDGKPHAPGPVLRSIPDHVHGVKLVVLRVEHANEDQRGVDGGHTDGVLRVLLGELLVDHDDVQEDVLLRADGDEVAHLVCRGASNHRRLVGAEHGVHLPEPDLLVLAAVLVDHRQEGARGDARREEVRLRR